MSVSTKIPFPILRRATTLNIATLQAPMLFLAITAFYIVTIGNTPVRVDEYYTMFAARSWADHGSFAILDGEYTRARLFTMLIGATFDLFGSSSILIARVPGATMTGLLVTVLFTWARDRAGPAAAITAALVLALSGYTLDVAHFARFYAPQALVVLGAAILVYASTEKAGVAFTTRLAAAAALLALGFHLQPTTLIAATALTLWLVLDRFGTLKAFLVHHLPVAFVTAGVLGGAALLIAPPLLQRFSTASVWAAEHRYDQLFYVQEYARQMPVLLILFPIAAALAILRNRRLALLALTVVMTTLLLHSFAAMKAGRYVYYCIPFIALIFGLAGAWVADAVIPASQRMLLHREGVAKTAAAGMLFGLGLTVLLANPSYRHTVKISRESLSALLAAKALSVPADPIWDQEAPALRRIIGPNEFLVVSDDLRTIAYLRPHDMLINTSHLSDLGATQDFTKDVRTGRPILGTVTGLDRMIDCRADGLIVIDDAHWRTPKGVTVAVADRIETRAAAVRPAVDHFRMFRWHHRPMQICPWNSREGGTV